jgi:hypothetical protein
MESGAKLLSTEPQGVVKKFLLLFLGVIGAALLLLSGGASVDNEQRSKRQKDRQDNESSHLETPRFDPHLLIFLRLEPIVNRR